VINSRGRRQRKSMSQINVVPYIDVMLVLLIIFMITAPLLTQGVKVDLPEAHAKTLKVQKQEPIIVSVDRKGQYFLNVMDNPDIALTPNQLLTRIAAELAIDRQDGKDESILVKGDRNVDYGRVVQAMVLLQHAGVEKVGLMTEEPNQRSG
jgi:biopolymer transport protein TolR